MRSRFFFAPANAIYGGTKGLYDLGPPLAAIQANVLHRWRKAFIEQDRMLEMYPCHLVPHIVLE